MPTAPTLTIPPIYPTPRTASSLALGKLWNKSGGYTLSQNLALTVYDVLKIGSKRISKSMNLGGGGNQGTRL